MLTSDSILSFLDRAFQNIEMPCLGNMNIDYLAVRLAIYRSPEQWLLLFNSVVWQPAAEGLMTVVELVGTGVVGRQGFDHDRILVPGCIQFDADPHSFSIVVRGAAIDPSRLRIQPDPGMQPEFGFWVAVALVEQEQERLLASPEEVQRFVPVGFQHLLTIDEWDHPTWDTPPSQTMAFPRIADVLVTADVSRWQPVAAANTHWSHWLPK